MEAAVIIQAVKKNVAFTDDLVKKLAGISLVQRSINKAKEITSDEHIYVVTDSEEICLICQRNGITELFEKDIKLRPDSALKDMSPLLRTIASRYSDLIILSPYAPLLDMEEVRVSRERYKADEGKLLIPVKREGGRDFRWDGKNMILPGEKNQDWFVQSQAFKIVNKDLLESDMGEADTEPLVYELSSDLIEIHSYQDWWVCEKLLNRKRIVFRVIGDEEVGMGHVHRALTLAHEVTDHEVRFVCEQKSWGVVNQLAGYDYWLGVYGPEEIEDKIIKLKPDLVINDILDTQREYVQTLQRNGIRVVSFEDFGDGVGYADLVINELYDEPTIHGGNIIWGRDYFFVREEFNDALPNDFNVEVEKILITFGGADPNDLTRKVLRKIISFCKKNNIKIQIITGPAYKYINELEKEVQQLEGLDIDYTHATGIMSHIMEQTQVAITSNGRTVYELAHMNIPSIVMSHHEREITHRFTNEKNGFIHLGVFKGTETEKNILPALKLLVQDKQYRRKLYDRLKPFEFSHNKEKIIRMILDVMEK